eukprot:6432341-Heterocapsa_arctica.AAC.1
MNAAAGTRGVHLVGVTDLTEVARQAFKERLRRERRQDGAVHLQRRRRQRAVRQLVLTQVGTLSGYPGGLVQRVADLLHKPRELGFA